MKISLKKITIIAPWSVKHGNSKNFVMENAVQDKLSHIPTSDSRTKLILRPNNFSITDY